MAKLPHKYRSGFGETDPDIDSFLRPDPNGGTNPYETNSANTGYDSRWDDAGNQTHYAGGGGGSDDAAFLKPSWTGDRDYVHQQLRGLIDGQEDFGSGNKLTGGGGPVSENKYGGVGDGKPRHAPKGPSYQVPKGSKGGI